MFIRQTAGGQTAYFQYSKAIKSIYRPKFKSATQQGWQQLVQRFEKDV